MMIRDQLGNDYKSAYAQREVHDHLRTKRLILMKYSNDLIPHFDNRESGRGVFMGAEKRLFDWGYLHNVFLGDVG